MANQFSVKNPAYEHLQKKWISKNRHIQNKIWDKHAKALKHLAVGSLGSLMILSSPPQQIFLSPTDNVSREGILEKFDKNILLSNELKDKIPSDVKPLDLNEEKEILSILSKNFGLSIVSELEGIRLNRNYGVIGGEQHLYRYPGDNLYQHADTTSDWARYSGAGIAQGLGAWGYFAPSKEEFSEKDKLREKYYLAIQTFLTPGFAENAEKYRDFFKFRKMLVVNPVNSQAVVAVIADAGPAEWTGKHLGGSPEVMDVLGLAKGIRKGAVLYFFIDDPEDKIELGPIAVKKEA